LKEEALVVLLSHDLRAQLEDSQNVYERAQKEVAVGVVLYSVDSLFHSALQEAGEEPHSGLPAVV
jgi:hypothetical protein